MTVGGFFFGALAATCEADIIVTADGESISGHEATVVDGVFKVPGDGTNPERAWALADLQRISFAPARPTGALKTRFVRIELPGDQKMLHIAEVQVFEGDENIAAKGKATQSSLYQNSHEELWGPQKAIDGNTDGNSKTAGTTHTNMETQPWWEVDLTKDATVKKIVLWNRTDDNVGGRIAGFRVILLDEKRNTLWTRTFPDAPNPSVEMVTPTRGDEFTEADLKAFDDYSGRAAAGGILNSLAGWLSGKPANKPVAATPQPASSPATPAAPAGAAPDIPEGSRVFQLAHGGRITGKLTKWADQKVTIEFAIGGQTVTQTIPANEITEILTKEALAPGAPLDRSQASPDLDTVYAKIDGGGFQAVSGSVRGLEGESLQFDYQGKIRKIAMARIAAILRQPQETPRTEAFAAIDVRGNHRIPGMIVSLADGKAVIETLWKERIEIPRTALIDLTVRNGRVTSLTDLDPAKAEHQPFLDRKLPHTVNRSINGSPLKIGDTQFERGLCTHSRTLLTYDVGQAYARLRGKVGMQKGDGDRGNAIVRVVSDAGVLFEKQITGATPIESLDVDTSKAKTLTLEVDYGENMDVGDHVVWGDPILVRGK
jgi:hypothetical protein